MDIQTLSGGGITASSTNTFTNKTYDTAGSGNSLLINGLAATANTGTGSVVRATAPTISQPNLVGVTGTSSAAAGSIGEYVESPIASGSAVSLVNTTSKNLTSISLTAGDWDVDAVFNFTGGATTTVAVTGGSLSQTTNTTDVTNGRGGYLYHANVTLFNFTNPTWFPVPPLRMSLSGTTTIYAVAYCQFAISTASVYGILRARRVF